MFKYENKEFYANSLSHAYTMFLDGAWGSHYVDYLKKRNIETENIYATDVIEEVEDLAEGYYKLKQKLENGAIFQIEVWENEDGSYDGLAQVV
ncbi:TPA: hypothetical protein ACWWDF_002424 [Enterococcus faecium]